jgi:plasmid maintenance system antidote protein VapI
MKKIDLSRLHARFGVLLERYMAGHRLKQGQVAKCIGMQRTHLNALINAKRPLSAHHLIKFIIRGIVKVSDIKDDCHERPEREMEFWAVATEAENISLLKKIARLRQHGVDVERLIDSVVPKKEGKRGRRHAG